jgi:hypothetical protein
LTTHYYVWYRVEGDVIAARAAVDALLRDIYATVAVQGRLLVRRDDPRTWMEVYENVTAPGRFEEALTAAALRRDVARFAQGGNRRLEPFVDPI